MSQVLMILAIAAGYGLFVLAFPSRRCGDCSGWGSRKRRRKMSACGRCAATGRTFRPGARFVHRGAALALQRWRDRPERES